MAVRPAAQVEDAGPLLFRSSRGLPMYRDAEGREAGSRYDAIGGLWQKATKLPLSGLRSTVATVADDWPDQRAVDIVLGHKIGHAVKSIRNKHYAKRFDAQRVRTLTEQVVKLAFGRK